MVAAGVEKPLDLWAFSRPFSATVWLALAVGLWIMTTEHLHYRLDENVAKESEWGAA
jgi:hypothetical protein